jgi:hypothetical protein
MKLWTLQLRYALFNLTFQYIEGLLMCYICIGLLGSGGSNSEKCNAGIEGKLIADSPDSGLSQGVKQNLQQEHNLNSGTLLRSSEYND